MRESITAAAVQMNSGEDKQANLARATQLIEEAAQGGAQLVALPEMFNCLGRFSNVVQNAETIPGLTSQAMSQLALRLRVTLLAGSICERSEIEGKGYNTSLLFSPSGDILAKYRKVHLFDVDLPNRVAITESTWIVAGNETVTAETPCGNLGLSICYDLRFPELYRRLADQRVEIILVPAAFTMTTGRDHWEILLRARAIENQAFIIAPNQWGRHGQELTTYGNSMIVDPWGRILARADDGEGMALAALDFQRLTEFREQIPALAHRRSSLLSYKRTMTETTHG